MRKKIIYITLQSPFETYTGAHQRSAFLLQSLLGVAEVDVVCFTKGDAYPTDVPAHCRVKYWGSSQTILSAWDVLRSMFSMNSLSPKSRFCALLVRELMHATAYDYVVVRYLGLVTQCGLTRERNLIVDVDDLPEQWYASLLSSGRRLSPLKRGYYWIKKLSCRYYSRKLLSRVGSAFFPNKSQVQGPNGVYLPNIPCYPEEQPAHSLALPKDYSVLFIGLMSYNPNLYGMDRFIDEVWPRVIDAFPEAVLNVVGKGLPADFREKWERVNGVRVKGFVERIDVEYGENAVVVAPIYEGAGTNIKVLEALGYRKGLVASPFALKGFDDLFRHGEELWVAEDAADFARGILTLFTDADLRLRLGNRGYAKLRAHYSFDRFRTIVQGVVNG